MKVFVLVNTLDGFVYGVFTNEDDAWEWGNTQIGCSTQWDIFEREVQ